MKVRDDRRLFWVWADMVQRCTNPKHKAWANYGGRGIGVADAWRTFAGFASTMPQRPEGGMLDRIDNGAGYGPQNCRWASRQEQNSNRRSCIYVDCDGETVTLKEACRRKGLTYRPVVKRIQDRGWPVSLALSTPIGAGSHFLASQVHHD